jgi:hypothetical protein
LCLYSAHVPEPELDDFVSKSDFSKFRSSGGKCRKTLKLLPEDFMVFFFQINREMVEESRSVKSNSGNPLGYKDLRPFFSPFASEYKLPKKSIYSEGVSSSSCSSSSSSSSFSSDHSLSIGVENALNDSAQLFFFFISFLFCFSYEVPSSPIKVLKDFSSNIFCNNNLNLDYINVAIFIPPRRLDIYEYDDSAAEDISSSSFMKNRIKTAKVAAVLSQGRRVEGLII